MRYAIISGYLTALSVAEKKNYQKLIKKRLSRRIKTSEVNRFLIEKAGDYACTLLLRKAKKYPDRWRDFMYKRYNPSLQSRVLYPFAKWRLAKDIGTFHKNLF